MGLLRFSYKSQNVAGYVDITITYPTDNISCRGPSRPHQATPESIKNQLMYVPGMKFQTVYLMHGGGDDDSLAFRYTNAELYAQENQVMLVTPSLVQGYGVDVFGLRYHTFLTEELPLVIQTLFASSPKREDNFILGYAKGANVAFGTAIMRPDLYSACVDISGGIGLSVDLENIKEEIADHLTRPDAPDWFTNIFSSEGELEGSRFDMYSTAKKHLEAGVQMPKFFLVSGSEEGRLLKRVERDYAKMLELGIDTTFIKAEGYKHFFYLWNDYIKIALDELLPLRRRPIYPDEEK